MEQLPTCGYEECDMHQFGINHEIEQTAAYRNRPLLCRLAIHLHSKAIAATIDAGDKRQCVRCRTTWRCYGSL